MNFSHRFPPAIFGAAMVSSKIVMMQFATPVALAADVQQIAREITVRIDGPGAGGSGFIVKREDDLYTVVTNWHVVDGQGEYTIKTEDGREYSVSQIQQLPGADLAVMYFTSSQSYRVAELGNSDNVREGDTVHVSGWRNPWSSNITEPVYSFIDGKITGRQRPNDDGYALIYNADGNYIGMSGGPLLTENGKVIGVNGLLDEADSLRGQRVASLAIPINTFERLQARVSRPVNPQPRETTQPSNTQSARAFLEQGLAYYTQGFYEGAIADFNQAIRLDSDYADAYYGRGNAYRRQGNYERAIADYTQAIRLDSNYAGAYVLRGNAYYDQGNYERAIADYTEALRLNPNYAYAYNSRGLAYYNQGNYERAIADYNQAIRINPEYAHAYYNRGLAYRRQGNNRQALESFRQSAELYRQQGKQEDYQDALERIRELE